MVDTRLEGLDLEVLNHGVPKGHQGYEAGEQFVYDVLTGKRVAGKHAIQACVRYVLDKQRSDLELRTNEVDVCIEFANLLKHVKGELVGQPIQLMDWMIFILLNAYGWYYVGSNKRRFERIFTLVARGNAKSFLCSIVGAWSLLTSPNGSPRVFSVARSSRQSKIVWEDAANMLRVAEGGISSLLDIRRHEILYPSKNGCFDYRSSDAKNLDGIRVSMAIIDELHAHPTPEILNTCVNGTMSTKNPQVFMISTAGMDLDGVCIQERDLVREINSGISEMDNYFGIEFSIDDEDDWTDEKCWIKANPSLGEAVKLDALRHELTRAKQNASNRTSFQTKNCNRFVSTHDQAYLDIQVVQQNRKELNIEDYQDRECYLGLDLAQFQDLTALTYIFPEPDGSITLFHKHYLPRSVLGKVSDAIRIRYEHFEDKGCLILTPTEVTDFRLIADDIRDAAKDFNLVSVGYDPWNAGQLANELTEEGIEMVEVRQSFLKMNEPAKLLQAMFADNKVNYSKEDICFEWCCSNAVFTSDQNENIKVHRAKEKLNAKVDSVVSTITGLALAKIQEQELTYESRGFLFL